MVDDLSARVAQLEAQVKAQSRTILIMGISGSIVTLMFCGAIVAALVFGTAQLGLIAEMKQLQDQHHQTILSLREPRTISLPVTN